MYPKGAGKSRFGFGASVAPSYGAIRSSPIVLVLVLVLVIDSRLPAPRKIEDDDEDDYEHDKDEARQAP